MVSSPISLSVHQAPLILVDQAPGSTLVPFSFVNVSSLFTFFSPMAWFCMVTEPFLIISFLLFPCASSFNQHDCYDTSAESVAVSNRVEHFLAFQSLLHRSNLSVVRGLSYVAMLHIGPHGMIISDNRCCNRWETTLSFEVTYHYHKDPGSSGHSK